MDGDGSALFFLTDEQEDQLNPFSFREFLRWKNQDLDLDQAQDQDQDPEHTHRKASSSQNLFDINPGRLTFDPGVRSCFFAEPSASSLVPQAEEEEEEEEEGWGQSYQSGIVDSTSSLCTEEEEEEEEMTSRFSSQPDREQRAAGAAGENYEGDDETSMVELLTSCKRRAGRSSHMQQLKQENTFLRRNVSELQKKLEVSERRVAQLSEELVQRRHQEEKEAQDLESMVQSVEQNLQLMTKRALKAESSVSKLKVEVKQLQTQVDTYRLENERLKEAESEVVMTMRHNAQVASEYLNKTASHAHSSIQQLLGEAETLHLVSQLLRSIDKMSTLNPES
ncbi:hypothetical protein LDENG_00241460 [Lucifuga dentata]|nr:hypothetical protein LDENG_00241460 [Lucifuga dentata]